MKIDILKKVIRQLVKEEVASEVNKVMGKMLVEIIKEVKSTSHNTQTTVESEEPETYTQGAILKTNNPKLSAVLAETARNFKPLKKTNEGASLTGLMAGALEKIGKGESAGVSEPVSKIDFLKSIITENVATPSALDGGDEVPDILQKVFKKDFRAVMKKIDEKRKTGGSGMINPAQFMS